MEEHRSVPPVRLDNEDVWETLQPRLKELVLGGSFILGRYVEEFEAAAAKAFGCTWAVGTSSGTSALMLALRASGLPAGSRVAIPANTFFATFEAVALAGHRPVIVDNDEDYLIDLDLLADLDVDAVVPVHLYGLPVDMDPLMEMAKAKGWWVLEDASQAHGATVGGSPIGSFGDASGFSAYPTKNLGAWGDAGFVTGSDPDLQNGIRALRHHGQTKGNRHELIGNTDRLDALQALVLEEKLRRLPDEVEKRRRVAGWYREQLSDVGLDLPDDRGDRRHAYHLFVVRVSERERVQAAMKERGVGTMIHYPMPVHLQPASEGRCDVPHRPERAETWASSILSLPMSPTLREDEVTQVCEALREALS